MLPTIEYNFQPLYDTFLAIKSAYTAKPEHLREIKDFLNKFFDDATCKEVLYSNNTDKMFFGIKIIPMIDSDDIYDFLIDDEPQRVEKYIVELDSHIFNPVLDLSPMELISLLLHEVNGIVGDASPIQRSRDALNAYLSTNGEHIKISKSIHYKEILAYGLKDYMSKVNSIFYNFDPTEHYANEFTNSYGLTDDLISAYRKLRVGNIRFYENQEISKFVVFSWTLSLYKNVRIRRIGAIKTLLRAKSLTGSRLERMEIDNVVNRIKRIDDDTIITEGALDTIRFKVKEKMRKNRLNNLRLIDSTYYELNMQIRNVEDEDDALFLMRQINTNIAIIDEYRSSADCDDYERAKWDQAYDKFCQLRERLSQTTVYKNKQFGIFIDYPEIVENRY